jgi:hypothetical protein
VTTTTSDTSDDEEQATIQTTATSVATMITIKATLDLATTTSTLVVVDNGDT